MSSNDSRFSTVLNKNKFITGSVVTGIVALFAIAGVMAWSNNTSVVADVKSPAVSQKQSAADTANTALNTAKVKANDASTPAATQTDEPVTVVAGSRATEDTAVLGWMTSQPSSQASSQSSNVATTAAVPAPSQASTVPVYTPTPVPAPAPAITPVVTPAPVAVPIPSPTAEPTPVPVPAPAPVPVPTPVPTAGFNRAAISLTFDDGWKSIYDNGLPIMRDKYGFVSTQYVNSESIEGNYSGTMTPAMVQAFAAAGHEIGWHTKTHGFELATADAATRDEELTIPGSFIDTLLSLNVTISNNFASPFGSYNDESIADIKAHGFTSHRSTDVGYNSRTDIDASHTKLTTDNIKVQNILNTTTTAEVEGWIADAVATKSWLVIVYHEVSNDPVDPDPTYSVSTTNFDAQLNAVKQSGTPVLTVQGALAELTAQL